MLYHDFIKCNLLNWNEKDIYIILLMYAKKDSKQCFPSISNLCKISGKSKNTVLKAINGLEDKKILKKEKRVTKKGQTSNLYTLYDYGELWNVGSSEEVAAVIDGIEEKRMIKALTAKGYHVSKEKGLASEPTKAHTQAPQLNNFNQSNTTTNSKESQLERHTTDQIKQFYDYNIMIVDHPERKKDIDIAFTILYDALNWTKPTIRIDGQDKPILTVIGRLMKLEQSDLWYAIEKYHEQQERIKNVNAYLLTILYHAKEQSYLDLMNLGHHNGDF